MGKFQDRMAEDIEIRGLSPETKRTYLRCVRRFVRHFMQPPDRLTAEHIRQYQLHLTRERKVAPSTFNQAMAALRFFYKVTLRKPWAHDRIPYQKEPSRLPQVLSREKVATLLSSVANLKHRALLSTCYAAGLRATEAVRLKVADIDSQRMTIRVTQGKGGKDRTVMLSPRLLATLREYWDAYQPRTWLFPGQKPDRPLTRHTLNRLTEHARKAAGLAQPLHPHVLRHSFASHLLELGVNICVIQRLLGHRSLRSTAIYVHVAADYLKKTPSPLDHLPDSPKSQGPIE
jgi:site-specific recombinase XerD